MRYGLIDGNLVEANETGERAICPTCKAELISKCGIYKENHWSHKSTADCDSWYSPMTVWHKEWQDLFPVECREVTCKKDNFSEFHRADVKINDIVIEFQHSDISKKAIYSRNIFYENIIWVVDAFDTGCIYQRDYRYLKTIESKEYIVREDNPEYLEECKIYDHEFGLLEDLRWSLILLKNYIEYNEIKTRQKYESLFNENNVTECLDKIFNQRYFREGKEKYRIEYLVESFNNLIDYGIYGLLSLPSSDRYFGFHVEKSKTRINTTDVNMIWKFNKYFYGISESLYLEDIYKVYNMYFSYANHRSKVGELKKHIDISLKNISNKYNHLSDMLSHYTEENKYIDTHKKETNYIKETSDAIFNPDKLLTKIYKLSHSTEYKSVVYADIGDGFIYKLIEEIPDFKYNKSGYLVRKFSKVNFINKLKEFSNIKKSA